MFLLSPACVDLTVAVYIFDEQVIQYGICIFVIDLIIFVDVIPIEFINCFFHILRILLKLIDFLSYECSIVLLNVTVSGCITVDL